MISRAELKEILKNSGAIETDDEYMIDRMTDDLYNATSGYDDVFDKE